MHTQNRRQHLQALIALAIAAGTTACATTEKPDTSASLERFVVTESFASRHVSARKVVVWLPAGYDGGSDRYSVLYMHDGQNLFDPATSMAGQPWAVDKALDALMREGKVRKTIVVGIWNSPLRWREYAPAAPIDRLAPALRNVVHETTEPVLSEAYLKFIVEELKPHIDKNFRTRADRDNTIIMGSSMGGLISLYALARYPNVFGGAGCVSTHWPMTTNRTLLAPKVDARVDDIAQSYFDWLDANLPRASQHRIYFDHGTINLDSLYAPFQKKADAIMRNKGYRSGIDWMTQSFEGADHNEPSWRARLSIPLTFLLRP
jgi:predicted alpha/beta superfamily hydrolase